MTNERPEKSGNSISITEMSMTPSDIASALGVSVKTVDRFTKTNKFSWRWLTKQQRYLNSEESKRFMNEYRTFKGE